MTPLDRAWSVPQARREFLRAAVRLPLLASLGMIGVSLWRRPGASPAEVCTRSGLCRGCPVLGACGLPPAVEARSAGPTP